MKKLTYIFCLTFGVIACEEIIEVEDISAQTVSILAPTNGSVINNNKVVFSWETLADADQYRLQIARPNFSNAIQIELDSVIHKTSHIKTLDTGDYQWRLRGENSGYSTEYTTQTFTVSAHVVDISNEQVVLLTPANNATFNTTDTINFSWETIDGATEYNIQIATPDFDNPVEIITDEIIANSNFSIQKLSQNTYKWQVKAKNSSFETVYTELGFTVN